jgi:microcystin-dependent protein
MKTQFTDGDITQKTSGTRVIAAFLNLIFNHRHDGLDQDGSAPLDYAMASGTENAITVELSMSLPAHVVGMPINVQIAAPNTGPVTIAMAGLAAVALTKRGTTPLAAGDLAAGQLVTMAYDGTQYQLTAWVAPSVTDMATLDGQSATQLAPPGMFGEFAMPTAPSGWLACDGSAVSRTTYAALFAAIGTTWGAGDNVSTFNVPDARGVVLRGLDNGRGIDVGRAFGTLQQDALRSHTHTYNTKGGVAPQSGSTTECWFEDASATTGATGDVETRMINITAFICIKY